MRPKLEEFFCKGIGVRWEERKGVEGVDKGRRRGVIEISTVQHCIVDLQIEEELGFMYLRSPDHVIAAQCDSLTVKLSLCSESTLVL